MPDDLPATKREIAKELRERALRRSREADKPSLQALVDVLLGEIAEIREWRDTTAEPDSLLTMAEAAETVKLSEKQLYRVAHRGGGPFRKIEGRWRVYESELHDWVRSHRPREQITYPPGDPMGPIKPRRRGSSTFRDRLKPLDQRGSE